MQNAKIYAKKWRQKYKKNKKQSKIVTIYFQKEYYSGLESA